MAHVWRLIALVLALLSSQAAHAVEEHTQPNCGLFGSLSDFSAWTDSNYCVSNSAWNYSCLAAEFRLFGASLYCARDRDRTSVLTGESGARTTYTASANCPSGYALRPADMICVRIVDQCPEYFYDDGGVCKPIPDCGVGNVWNGSACEPIPDPPLCNPPKVIIGDACVMPPDPDAPCQPPNVLVNGQCVPPCPAGLSRIDGVCKCPVGKVYIDGQCKDPECPHPLGTSLGGEGQYTSASYGGSTFCYSQCVVYPSFSGRDPVSGQWFANGPLTSTGVACTGTGNGPTGGGPEDPSNPDGGDPPPPEDPPYPCAKGRCSGMVNGVRVCLPCSDTSSSSSSSSSSGGTNPGDGAGGTGGQPGTGNGEGSSSSTTNTTCTGGKCTTTTTTTTTDGEGNQTQATETKEEPKEDFCTQNPKSPHCVEGSFGGACDGGFTCDGDPVACATAKAANEQACMLKVDPANSVLGIGNNALGGGNGDDHPRGLTVNHDIGVLDQTNPWGGSCPSDIQVPVMGNNLTIPLSELCTALQAMGAIAVAFTLMAAAFIVVRGT